MTKRPALLRILPFGLLIGIMALNPVWEALLPENFDARWLYAVRTLVVFAALLVFWKHYEELREGPSVRWSDWAMGLGVGVVVFVLWVNLDFRPLAFAPGQGFDPRDGGTFNLGLTLFRLAGATLLVPVVEELFWRSFLLRWLQHPAFLSVHPGAVATRALLISSALFASEHRLWFAGLLAGLAYGWVYKRSGNLWVPIVAHAVTNGLLGAYVLATGAWSFW